MDELIAKWFGAELAAADAETLYGRLFDSGSGHPSLSALKAQALYLRGVADQMADEIVRSAFDSAAPAPSFEDSGFAAH